MKAIILAGGYGTRLSEYTDTIPKPMVTVGGIPILVHVMKCFAHHGVKDFVVALGYRGDVIKDYFLNYCDRASSFEISLFDGSKRPVPIDNSIAAPQLDWNVTLLDTGLNTMTAGRIRQAAEMIADDQFFVTYGDGVGNVDIKALMAQHRANESFLTLTAVRPPARFGELEIDPSGLVQSFEEKPQLQDGWINGGFFMCERSCLRYINDDDQMFEREPLAKLAAEGKLAAYKHYGFWQCMDTIRDKKLLDKLSEDPYPPWLVEE